MKIAISIFAALMMAASVPAQERLGGYIHSDGMVPMEGNFKLDEWYLSRDGDSEGLAIDASGNVYASGNINVAGNVTVTGTVTQTSGTLNVASLSATATVLAEQLTSSDDANVTDDLTVGGNITLGAASQVTGNKMVSTYGNAELDMSSQKQAVIRVDNIGPFYRARAYVSGWNLNSLGASAYDIDTRVETSGKTNSLVVIGSSGFVGINTHTPTKTLSVNGTGNWIGLPEYPTKAAADAALANGDLYLFTNATQRLLSVAE